MSNIFKSAVSFFGFLLFAQIAFSSNENPECIGLRCTYRLINPAVFSGDQIQSTAIQALTGNQHRRLDPQEVWIGSGSGPFENLEVAFWAKNPKKLEELKKIIIQLDKKYNNIPLTPIRITALIYAVDESSLRNLGFGIDGYYGGDIFNKYNAAEPFSPTTGIISAFAGGFSKLLRIQLNAMVESGKAMRIEDRSKLTYHGSSFQFSDLQDYFRDGTVNTTEAKLGFELRGNIFLDEKNKNVLNISNLNLFIGIAPSDSQTRRIKESSSSPYGVRKMTSPSEYEKIYDGVPKIIYETIVYAHFGDDSFGLFTGVKKGGEASRLLVIINAEIDPASRPVPEFATETPRKLRRVLTPKSTEGWHVTLDDPEEISESNNEKYKTFNENLYQ
ncbi:MAG: hypothetical protein H6625_04125 [Bdellovibrionaceae bacterium]|nr:hypothetical protein [Pseudobdellovibrionaceae bacterium]